MSKCGKCAKTVYFMEQQAYKGGYWHQDCFACGICSKKLVGGSYQEHKDMPYCTSCYNKNFRPKGYGFGAPDAGLSTQAGTHTPAAPAKVAATPAPSRSPPAASRAAPTPAAAPSAAGGPKFCSGCGTARVGAAKFCSNCGGGF